MWIAAVISIVLAGVTVKGTSDWAKDEEAKRVAAAASANETRQMQWLVVCIVMFVIGVLIKLVM